jgi:CBS domain-containing protein
LIESELQEVTAALREGRPTSPVTVRNFLSWFGVQRRGVNVVHYIRQQLDETGLITVPDFESTWIDGQIELCLRNEQADQELSATALVADAVDTAELLNSDLEPSKSWASMDPTYRISKLAAANGGVTSVGPDAILKEAVTLMMATGYSQLPVMTGERSLKGIISWKSIGSRLALGQSAAIVSSLMENAYEVSAETSIFEAISDIVRYGYVLVRGRDNKITGIVTASDLSLQFRTLTEPFLLLGEIENLIRNMIGDRFSSAELKMATDPGMDNREVSGVADLSFGEYVRLLEKPDRWDKLCIAIDRSIFCKNLDRVREIRNDVAHFDPDGITPDDLGLSGILCEGSVSLDPSTRR